ncbi:hypothetical protein [Georgenia soli]|uniref:hypothetical protein n=1 Tax=Georgenia soli TaxID=638953 RepID=UPI00117B7CBF|nr:hypothetical protein [Georgenia soli]
MPYSPDNEFEAYWRSMLVERDRATHLGEADRTLQLELEGLRTHCAELTAALTQARAAIVVRHELLKDQAAALSEKEEALSVARAAAAAAAERAGAAEEAYEAVVTSRRWRLWNLPANVAAGGRRVLTRRMQ